MIGDQALQIAWRHIAKCMCQCNLFGLSDPDRGVLEQCRHDPLTLALELIIRDDLMDKSYAAGFGSVKPLSCQLL